MLSILDRYISKSFIYSYAVCSVAILGLTMVLDSFMRVKKFMVAARAGSIPGLGVLAVMAQYYLVRIPVFFQMISPAVILAAGMFCVAQMNKNNEIIPMKASGISMYRTLAPIFIFAVALTGVLVVNQEIIIPALVPRLKHTYNILEGKTDDWTYEKDAGGNLWEIARYQPGVFRMHGQVCIESYYQTGGVRTHIIAESAVWKRTDADGLPRWHLSVGTEARRTPEGRLLTADEGGYNTTFEKEGYIVRRPGDRAEGPFTIVSSLTPVDVDRKETNVQHVSSIKLSNMLDMDPSRTDIAVKLHQRYAFPLSNIVLLLLGLPFVLGTESKGTFGGLVVCVAICAAFYGIHLLCGELGRDRTVSAAAAAWLPIALFAPLGLYLFDNVNT